LWKKKVNRHFEVKSKKILIVGVERQDWIFLELFKVKEEKAKAK
jgi:hypothetical protein